jgi:hypothetical protein
MLIKDQGILEDTLTQVIMRGSQGTEWDRRLMARRGDTDPMKALMMMKMTMLIHTSLVPNLITL